MDTGGTRHLRQTLDAGLDFLARNHHQVGHLVHNHDDIGQRYRCVLFRLENRLAGVVVKTGLNGAAEHLALGQRLTDAAVIAFNVAHTHFGHLAIAVFHLAHGPFQRHKCLFRVSDDG